MADAFVGAAALALGVGAVLALGDTDTAEADPDGCTDGGTLAAEDCTGLTVALGAASSD